MARSATKVKIGSKTTKLASSSKSAPLPSNDDADSEILDDRDLLTALNLSDSQAAMFLGRSRQTLTKLVGSKKKQSGDRSTTYLKPADIYVLIGGAVSLGIHLDIPKISSFIENTKNDDQARKLLLASLKTDVSVDWKEVCAMILILPDFRNIQKHRTGALQELKHWIKKLQNNGFGENIVSVSETTASKDIAGKVLDIPSSQCIKNDIAEHHLPTALIYEKGKNQPSIYVMTQNLQMAPAPVFKIDIIAACGEAMLGSHKLADYIRNQK